LARIVRERYPGLPIVLATAYSQCAAQAMNEVFRLVENLMIAIGWPPQFGQSWNEPLVYRAHPNQPHRRWECVNVGQRKTTKGASIEPVISAVFRLSFSIPSPRCPCPGLVPSGAAGTRKPNGSSERLVLFRLGTRSSNPSSSSQCRAKPVARRTASRHAYRIGTHFIALKIPYTRRDAQVAGCVSIRDVDHCQKWSSHLYSSLEFIRDCRAP